MGLAEAVRAGVAVANAVTKPLQVSVVHEPWVKNDKQGGPKFGAPIARLAIVEQKAELRRLPNGKEVLQRARVTFLAPIAANGATGRREPVDPRDKLTLPDGTTGPILDVAGMLDKKTNRPYLIEVALG